MQYPRTALLRRMTMAAAGVALMCVAAGPASADQFDQKTIFTFSEAVELPGRTLPAGTYTFVLADSPSSRHIIRVFNEDESQVITTLLAVSANRMEPSDEPMVSFAERGEEAAPAIQYWFYPGRTIGHEFVYPREQAMRIARDTRKPVLASDAATDEDAMASGAVTRIGPDGRESEYSDRTAQAAQQDRETTATATAMEGSPDRPVAPPQAALPAPRLSTESDETSQSSVPAATARPSSPATGVQSGQQVDERGARTEAQRDSSAMSAQRQPATRPSTLPQTAGPEPIFLLLGVSCALALGALGNIGRRM